MSWYNDKYVEILKKKKKKKKKRKKCHLNSDVANNFI